MDNGNLTRAAICAGHDGTVDILMPYKLPMSLAARLCLRYGARITLANRATGPSLLEEMRKTIGPGQCESKILCSIMYCIN